MKIILSIVGFVLGLNLYAQQIKSDFFNIELYRGYYCIEPKKDTLVRDTVHAYTVRFPDYSFMDPLKNELTDWLNKKVFNYYNVDKTSKFGDIFLYVNNKGEIIYVHFIIVKEYMYMFNEKILEELYNKLYGYRFDLPKPAHIFRQRLKWTPPAEDDDIITSGTISVDTFNYFMTYLKVYRRVIGETNKGWK